VFVTDAGNREVLEYDGASGAVQRWYAYAPGPNDVLNQMNVTSGTRATLIPDIQGSIIAQDSVSGALTRIGYLPYGKSPSAGPVRLHRSARRCRDGRVLLLPRAALLAGMGPLPAARPDRIRGQRESLCVCRE
jgi:hypothetical protein